MPDVGAGTITITPDWSRFNRDLNSGIGRNFDDAGKKAGRRFSGGLAPSFKGIAGMAAAAFAGVKVVSLFGDFITEAREAEKIGRITANAIRVTGGAANVSAKQVGRLSEALSIKTGIDDEVIQTGANLLLTFKNVRNEAGRGANIFDRATTAAADLSIQFGSVDGASKVLGKALNDPIKGIAALSRAGVQFTQQQKDQIRTLVESGDVLGAQKIILGEVESQVGGAAEAAADPMQKLGVVVGNLKEQIGAALLPAVGAAATWLGANLPRGLDLAGDAFGRVRDAVAPFRDDAERLAVAIRDRLGEAFDWIAHTAIPAVTSSWADLTKAFQSGSGEGFFADLGRGSRVTLTWISEVGLPAVRTAADSVLRFFRGDGGTAISGAFGAIRDYVMWAQDTWATVFRAVPGILAPAMDTFGRLSDTIREALGPVGELVSAIGTALAPVLRVVWPIVRTLGIALGVVGYITHRVFLAAIDLAAVTLGWFTRTILPALTWYITNVVTPAIRVFTAVFLWLFERVGGYAVFAWNSVIKPVFDAVVGFVRDRLEPQFHAFMWVAQAVWDAVSSAVSSAWDFIKPKFEAIVSFVNDTLVPVWDKISSAVGSAFDKVPDIIGRALRSAGNLVAGFLRGAAGIADAVGLDAIAGGLEDAATRADKWGETANTGRAAVRAMAGGGHIKPAWGIPGKDSVPAMLMPGEVVIRKASVDKYGVENLLDLNEGKIPGFANGGALLRGAKFLMGKGARISEHPMFGGVGGGHARGGYHYSNKSGTGGDAFDANFGPGGQSQTEMAFFDRYASTLRDMGLRVLWRVKDHFNHLHADIGSGGGGGGGGISGFVDKVGDALRGIASGSLERVWPAMDGAKGLLGLIPGGVNYLRGHVLGAIKGSAGSMGGAATGGAARSIVQGLAAARGWTGSQWAALDRLIQKESSWNPNAANPTSSARGLFQKMTSIHGPLEPTIEGQANWGFNYIAGRYGDPISALAFHDRNNWYAKGGLVHAQSFDSGGVLRPGWNMVNNQTGADEILANVTDGGVRQLADTIVIREQVDADAVFQQANWYLNKGSFV